ELRDDLSARFEVTETGEHYEQDSNTNRDEDETSWELSGDYSHQLANGNQFKFLFLFSDSSNERVNTYTGVVPNQSVVVNRIQEERQEDSESILRSTYRWGIT